MANKELATALGKLTQPRKVSQEVYFEKIRLGKLAAAAINAIRSLTPNCWPGPNSVVRLKRMMLTYMDAEFLASGYVVAVLMLTAEALAKEQERTEQLEITEHDGYDMEWVVPAMPPTTVADGTQASEDPDGDDGDATEMRTSCSNQEADAGFGVVHMTQAYRVAWLLYLMDIVTRPNHFSTQLIGRFSIDAATHMNETWSTSIYQPIALGRLEDLTPSRVLPLSQSTYRAVRTRTTKSSDNRPGVSKQQRLNSLPYQCCHLPCHCHHHRMLT